jgi:hypothetical protein
MEVRGVRVPENAWVFDTGPLRNFAMQGWLGVLRFLAEDRPVYVPQSVERELKQAGEIFPAVRAVLEADWIQVHRTFDDDFSKAFAHYADRLIADGKNQGECGYSPWASFTSAKW